MTSLFFTNTLMLAGMAALAIPILIHLLLKRKKKQIAFSTIRFFQHQDEQSSQRRKLRNWLLLALRLLIVSLLVLAFARPYSRQSEAFADGRKPHRVVFVLDRSASMLAGGSEGQRWALARERIQKTLSTLEAEDSAALIECAAQANVLSGFAPPAALGPVVRDLAPGYSVSSISEGLQQAVKLLTGGPANCLSTIYLVTDLQKNGCRGLNTSPVPQDVEIKVLEVGDLSSPNLAVVRLDVQPQAGASPHVDIASFSDEDSEATLTLAADSQPFGSQSVQLKAGSSTNLAIALPPLKPGWHDVKASLKTHDSLDLDNTQYACLFVPEPARVLMVEPRDSARVFEQATFFVSSALDPSAGSTNTVLGSFRLGQVRPEALARELDRPTGESRWNVVILPGLKDLPSGIGKYLAAFVQCGGGLVLFLDEGMSANRYNSELADLLPARLGNPEQAPDVLLPWRIALYDTNTFAFAAFRWANSGDLRIPEFTKRFGLEMREGSERLAFFDDGVALVVTRAWGKGRVALVNTSADATWTDWPKHKTFVPFLHGLTTYAGQKTGRDSVYDTNGFVAGEDQDIEMGTQGRLAPFELRKPDGDEIQLTGDEKGRLKDPGLTLPGTYSLRDKAGHEVRRLAVNLPVQESNLEALRPADFVQQLVRVQENPKQTLAAGLFGSHNDQRQFWTALLLGVLILLLVEPFVANRTSV
jgi:hypothetical protein